MKIFTYNFYARPETVFWDNQKDRIKLFEESFRMYELNNGSIDVILFQELFDDYIYKAMKKVMLRLGFEYSTGRPDKLFYLNGGSMIFSKHKIIAKDFLIFKKAVIYNKLSAKGFNYACIMYNKKKYHIGCTHLDSFSPKKRLYQMKKIKSFLKTKLIPATEPIIIGGDFNIDMDSREIDNVRMAFSDYTIANKKYDAYDDSKNNTSYWNNDWIKRRKRYDNENKKNRHSYWIDFFIYKNIDTKHVMQVEHIRSVKEIYVKKIIYSTPFYFNIYNPFSYKIVTDLSDHYAVSLQF